MKIRKKENRKDLLFYCCMIALPILQVSIFYIYMNFNSVLLAFKSYEKDAIGQWGYTFVGGDNFIAAVKNLVTERVFSISFKNSILLFFFSFVFGTFLAEIFSYYIYKKYPLSKFFQIILFLPQIVSSVVMVIIFKYLAEEMIPTLCNSVFGTEMVGLLTKHDTAFSSVLVYSIFISYGSSILLFLGAMNNINESVLEAGQLDGMNVIQEFLFIAFPSVWSTFVTLTITAIAGIFANQMNLYTIYGKNADYDMYTIGYYLYTETVSASYADYPYLSALGIIFSVVLFPICLLTRRLMLKYGPSEE